MTYPAFVDNKPALTDDGDDAVDYMRNNLMALQDMVAFGTAYGWAYSQSGGTDEKPTYRLLSKGTYRLRGTYTYGTTGGEADNVTQVIYEQSSNSGSSYDTIKTGTFTYSTGGIMTASSWS